MVLFSGLRMWHQPLAGRPWFESAYAIEVFIAVYIKVVYKSFKDSICKISCHIVC